MRREWIEIDRRKSRWRTGTRSPSMRREWIEMVHKLKRMFHVKSPSMRREWIEIWGRQFLVKWLWVSLHAEGVD